MRLVEDHVDPVFASENVLIGQDDLVRRDAHLEMVLSLPADTFLFPFLLVAVIGENLDTWEKLLELHLPVEDDRGGDDDEVLAPDALVARKMSE